MFDPRFVNFVVLEVAILLSTIGACLLLLGVWKLFEMRNKKEKKVNVQHMQGAAPMVVDLNSLEPKPFSGWKLNVQGDATVLVGDNLVVTGRIVSLDPVAASYDNPRFGRVEMGGVPGAGYTQYSYREHRGGVIDVPYAVLDGQLLIGYFHEPRFLTKKNGKTMSLAGMPGGFANPGEDALTAAQRELEAELGLDTVIFPLKDVESGDLPGVITNRAFVADDDDKNSNKYFGLAVEAGGLMAQGDGTYKFNFNYAPVVPDESDKSPEANMRRATINNAQTVAKLTFVPWTHIGLLGRDGLIQAGVLRIVSMFYLGILPTAKTKTIICPDIAGKQIF